MRLRSTATTHYSTGVRSNGTEGRPTQALALSSVCWTCIYTPYVEPCQHSSLTQPCCCSFHALHVLGLEHLIMALVASPSKYKIDLTKEEAPQHCVYPYVLRSVSAVALLLVLAAQSACQALGSCFRKFLCQIYHFACAPADHWPVQGIPR